MNRYTIVVLALLLMIGLASAGTITRTLSIPNAIDPTCRSITVVAKTEMLTSYQFGNKINHETKIISPYGQQCMTAMSTAIMATKNGSVIYNKTIRDSRWYWEQSMWMPSDCYPQWCPNRYYAQSFHSISIPLKTGGAYNWSAFTSMSYGGF